MLVTLPPMRRGDLIFLALSLGSFVSMVALAALSVGYAPVAQRAAGGLAQKIFYFHVPAAYALYLSGLFCAGGSFVSLQKGSLHAHATARAGAECAVAFGVIVLTSGPLWAKQAWGVYWTWDPRLTTLLLSVLVYAALSLLYAMLEGTPAELRFLAAFGLLGTVNLPIIHLSVRKWGGNHPSVITGRGGGITNEMALTLGTGFVAFTLLCLVLLWLRATHLVQAGRLAELEATPPPKQALTGDSS